MIKLFYIEIVSVNVIYSLSVVLAQYKYGTHNGDQTHHHLDIEAVRDFIVRYSKSPRKVVKTRDKIKFSWRNLELINYL